MNQESLVQSSQAILQGLAEGGYIHAKTPKFESFFGDDKKNKLDFDMWERQVLSAATTHSGTAVKQAMMQSLKGQALMVISALPPETSWDKLLQALKIKYQDKASYDVLMAQFYGTKIEPDEKCASFGTRLEQKLNQVSLQYPNKISESMYWNCVRESARCYCSQFSGVVCFCCFLLCYYFCNYARGLYYSGYAVMSCDFWGML